MIGSVIKIQHSAGGGPVVVHCRYVYTAKHKLLSNYNNYSDTVSRSGVYCAVSNAVEQCKTEGVVDVFQVTKETRSCYNTSYTTKYKENKSDK